MRIVITGAAGRLGAALHQEFAAAGHDVIALGRRDLDITVEEQVGTVLKGLRPDAILNCSAYNAVDAAEADPASAFALNAHGPANLARAAREGDALLVHYSTDFVFDGRAREPYSETAATNPLSVYGASKLQGEDEVRRLERHYILRLESLFGGTGIRGHRSTIDQIADSILKGLAVRVVRDRTVSPSRVSDVTRASRELLERGAPFGTYHCVNSGFATWYDVALEISRQLFRPADIVPVFASDLVTPALRPRFCALANQKLLSLGIEMPSWGRAIAQHLAIRGAEPSEATLNTRTA
jgi:dTDP-4-dehydrorhamnose reductase